MRLRYLGTGTVHVEGAGEISTGGELEVPETTATALLEQLPEQWQPSGGATSGPVEDEAQGRRARRGR